MRSFFFLLLLLLNSSTILAQQSPMIDTNIPLFVPNSTSYRTNLCDRGTLLFNGEIILRDALRGLNLTVAMTNYAGIPNANHFFELIDNRVKETDPGLFVVIMDELARRAGFEWRNSFAAIGPLNSAIYANKTWTDLLEWETTHFDVAADYWAKNVVRMSKGISFPQGWYDGSVVLVTSSAPPEGDSAFWSFLLPFLPEVWLAIFGAIIFTGIAYFVLERLNSDADEAQLEDKPLASLFLAAITFTGHFAYEPDTNAARLLSFSWTFWALIVGSAYTANMASFLVNRNEVAEKVATINDALRLGIPVCVVRGAVIDELLSVRYPKLSLIRKATELEMFEGLRKGSGVGGCGALLTNLGTFEVYQHQKEVNGDCALTTEKRVLLSLPAGFATAIDSGVMCTSLASYVFDLHLQEMVSEGFVANAWQDHLRKISTTQCMDEVDTAINDETFSLTMYDMGGIFILHSGMSILALVIALYQYFYTKYRQPTKTLRPLDISKSIRGIQNSFRTPSTRLSKRSKSERIGRVKSDGSVSKWESTTKSQSERSPRQQWSSSFQPHLEEQEESSGEVLDDTIPLGENTLRRDVSEIISEEPSSSLWDQDESDPNDYDPYNEKGTIEEGADSSFSPMPA